MSMDDMLYDAARDAAVEQCDELRDELLQAIREVEANVDRNVDEHGDMIDRIDSLERDMSCLGNVASLNEIADLHSRINELETNMRAQLDEHGVPYYDPNEVDDGTGYTYMPIQADQRRAIFGLLKAHGWTNSPYGGERLTRIAIVNAILQPSVEIASFTQLSETQADEVIGALQASLRIQEQLA